MQAEVDIARLADALRTARAQKGLGVRAAASEAGVGPSTLSRVERGNVPDLDTYIRLCRWLDVSPTYFTVEPVERADEKAPPPSLPERVRMQLRSDPVLPAETVSAFVTMLEVAYAAAKAKLPAPDAEG